MEAATDCPLVRIGELSWRVGVNGPLLRAEFADLARHVLLALAGAGAAAQIADAAGARLMAGDPVTEAERAGWPR
jgi:hypothetical protein